MAQADRSDMAGSARDGLGAMSERNSLAEPHDFSLVLGGPIFQIFRRMHLVGDHLELLKRRILFITAIAWLPLLFLAVFATRVGTENRLLFIEDFEAHVRFLVALPVLIWAELIVHLRIHPVVRRFVERRIVLPRDLPRFDRAVDSAIRLRNSIPAEIGLLLIVYTLGLWFTHSRLPVASATWYASTTGRWHLTPAGVWYLFVSIPIAQFILLRWYLRFFIWFRFLWHVSRIDLNLIATHPDRCGGLAFVGKSSYAFGPILFAQGAMLAGLIATKVLYGGESLQSFKLQIAGFIVFFVFAILGPLVMFTPGMSRAKRKGLADYGQLAQRYVEDFEQKWVARDSAPSEGLLGASDIQSLADLGNSYSMVRDMNVVPFGLQDITRMIIATAAPLAPLLFTIFSPEEMFTRVLKIVFGI
jgi:hypothetical protein